MSGDPTIDATTLAARDAMRADPKTTVQLATKVGAMLHGRKATAANRIALAQAEWLEAEAYLRLNQPDLATPLITRALAAIANVPQPFKLRADLLLTRGGVNQAKVGVAGALADYQAAYKTFEALGQMRSQAIALQGIASLYRQAGDLATSIKYVRQSAEVYPGDPGFAVSTHNNQGNTLQQLRRYGDAKVEYQKALATAEQMSSPILKVRILGNLARAQVGANDIKGAEESLRQATAEEQNPDVASFIPQLLAIEAEVAYRRAEFERAGRLIGRAFEGLDLAKTGLADRDAHETAYRTYEKLGRLDLALAHLVVMKRIDDSNAKLAASTNTALMAARFDYANQDLKIAKLRQRELQRNIEFERSRAQLQRTIFIGIVLATLVGVSMLTIGLITIRRSRNEVRAANIVLGETNQALEKALAAKTEFLATTSHEIRTPLNGILGMTQVMLADERLAPDMRDRISVVHGAGVTMRALVDDILDVAKMESGNMTIEHVPVDLPATLTDVSRLWNEQAREKGLDFKLDLGDCPHIVEGDAARLRQIVFNLLSNALKFTEKGAITLAAAAEGDRLRVRVRDTGIGIPADKRELVFESFRQVDAGTTRRFGGTGLGLAICRNLARAMDGEVTVESDPGQGSCFTIDLPLVLVDGAAMGAAAEAEAAGRALLIADRNPITRSMLKALFERRAGMIEAVGSLDDALSAIKSGRIGNVLVDEAVIKATDDPAAALAMLAAAASEAGAASAILWAKPEEADPAILAASGIGRIVTKPIAGAALVEMLYPAPADSGGGAAQDLVSCAA